MRTGAAPVTATDRRYAEDPHWRDLVLFHEYFHGDTGRGPGRQPPDRLDGARHPPSRRAVRSLVSRWKAGASGVNLSAAIPRLVMPDTRAGTSRNSLGASQIGFARIAQPELAGLSDASRSVC